MMTYVPARQCPEQSRLGVVLLLSLLLHLALLSAIRVQPLHYGRFTPFEQPSPEPIELRLELPAPRAATGSGDATPQPESTTPVATPPTTPYREKQPVGDAPHPQETQELQAEFYEHVQDGDYASNIVSQDRAAEQLDRQFGTPSSPYNSHAATTPHKGNERLKEDQFRDGNMRVTIFDEHGKKKRCLEALPDDLLNEFDYGGYFMAVVVGC
jgi:hypothetical protein